MELEYNGVLMKLLTLDRVERVAVMSRDGMDLLYITWIISASCIYSPGGTPVGTATISVGTDTDERLFHPEKVRPPTGPRGTPSEPDDLIQEIDAGEYETDDPQAVHSPTANLTFPGQNGVGFSAAVTDAELQKRLMIPRQKLIIHARDTGGDYVHWLESPLPTFPVDAAGGPFPISCTVLEAQGEGRTFAVNFQIKTSLVPVDIAAEQLVLSHRWEMRHEHDDDNYLTRTTVGEIVFNAAVVEKFDLLPDLFRNQFILPIPLGFRRKNPQLVASSDGLTIGYTIHDVDPTVTFDPGNSGCTQIQIAEKMGYRAPKGF
jgi:hypothetical protein